MGRKRKPVSELTISSAKRKIRNLKQNTLLNNQESSTSNLGKEQLVNKNNIFCDVLPNPSNIEYLDIQIAHSSEINDEETSSCEQESVNVLQSYIKVNDDPIVTEHLKKVLRKLSIKHKFNRTGVSDLLKSLHDFFPKLPLDYRSLLNTPKETPKRIVKPGVYTHINIKRSIQNILRCHKSVQCEILTIDLFIDGVALFKDPKNNKSCWVILGRLSNVCKKVFTIGIYCGLGQPFNFNELIEEMIFDLETLIEQGIVVNEKIFKIQIGNFCLDSPARASVCYVMHHNGYNSCYYCTIKGFHDGTRMTFTTENSSLRTDSSFRERLDPLHHKETSSLIETKTDVRMISQFPPDYLHFSLLGGVKKILRTLFATQKPELHHSYRTVISDRLELCNIFLPSEFHRKIRPLNDVGSYHGNELRLFLLKLGPVVLQNAIPTKYYNHFLYLHIGISILCDLELCLEKNLVAEQLLKVFTKNSTKIYDSSFGVSVIHNLNHLAAAVRNQQKPLDAFSTFPFESFLTPIKDCVRSKRKPLEQIHRRIIEYLENEFEDCNCHDKNEKLKFINMKRNSCCDSVIVNGNVKISSIECRDRFLLTKKREILVCLKIIKSHHDVVFECKELKILGDLYQLPIESRKIDMYVCESTYEGERRKFHLYDIKRKMIGLPHNEKSMVFAPLKCF